MGSFQWRIGICLTSVIVYQNLIFHAWGEVVVPAANCSSLGAVKLTHRVFLKSRVVILRGFDDTLVASGDEYLQTKLLHNIAYQQLTARDEAFVFVDQIARNESWFLPIDLECVRDHLVFIGIYIISTDEFSPLDSHCSTDRVHCLVEGEVKVIPQDISVTPVTLVSGECVYIPARHAVYIEGGGVLATWKWSPMKASMVDTQQCSERVEVRKASMKQLKKCSDDPKHTCPPEDEHLARLSTQELVTTILCTKICMAAQGDMREFNDLLLAEFSSNSSTDLEALVEPFVSELFFSGDIPCSSPQFISTARRIAQALVSEDTSLSTAQLLPDSLCSNTIAGEASAVVYATEGGYQDPREGMSASEFSTLNPATGSVVIRDGTISPENFITDFVLVSKPLLLKGLAREQKAFLRWQDQYLVNVLTSSGRHASLKDKEDVMFELLYGEEALLNGLISEELAGDLTLPSPICDSAFRRHLVRSLIKGDTKMVQTRVDDLKSEVFDQFTCQLDGYANYVLIAPEDSHSVPLESGSRISEANLDDLDREQYGSLLSVSWLSATVEPGDCLYIPNRWFRFATYHKRMLGLDFNWNPFSGRPNQSDNQRNCSLSVGSETAEEEHRYHLLESMTGPVLDVEDLKVILEQLTGTPHRGMAAQTTLDMADKDKDLLLSIDEVISMDRSVIREAFLEYRDESLGNNGGDSEDADNPYPSTHDEVGSTIVEAHDEL